jgi:hypothetical protein
VKSDPVIIAINRYRAARAEVDKIAVREPLLPNGNPADETEEYLVERGERVRAHDRLAAIYADFAEGFDTPDLRDARVLINQLS